ncbi:MAG: PQQ-like beta-propeller repeat protein, partial [Planctomycetia bacterium]|nr:PQQ-like beta-propeller repeat protein [Planctomycetia bacterium]
GGAGPRATPTIDEGRVYALGATGLLNCLDGRTGKQLWQRDVRTENQAKNLEWGFSASPLIVGNLVVVSAGDKDNAIQKRTAPHYTIIAYDKRTGQPVWRGGTDNASYCSPALATICGVRQIVIANAGSVTGHDITDGHVLWEFPWQREMPTVSQVVPLGNDLVFVSKGYNAGCGVRQISRDAGGKWSATDVWSKPTLMRTKFTNIVLRDNYAYGLNDGFLECIDVKKGARRWTTRNGRTADYEHGQVLLVGDLLLVQSEQGDVALVEASPKKFHEVTRFSAISGRTWNYPVLIGRYLLVRNDHEAACFELPAKE